MRPESILTTAITCLCLILTTNTGADTLANDADPEAADQYTEDVFNWETSTPSATDFDWVQLVSGEWLKGEIKGLYKNNLEFDSDKLDLLQLDWDDVKYVESHIPGSAYIEGHGTVYGYITINQTKITVTNGKTIQQFDRSTLVSFITGEMEEKNYWSAKLTLGLNIRRGNTDQLDYTSRADLKRQTSFSRIILNYIGNVSNIQNVETSNNQRFNATHDIFKTRHFFLRPLFFEYFRDPFQNIDSKVTLGTGLGYTILDTKKTNWEMAGGPAYQATRFVSVETGEDIQQTTPTLVLSTDYDLELSSSIDFILRYSTQWGNEASGGYIHHLVSTIESEITTSFDLDISLIWDHISNPATADDGITPVKDDYRLTVGISYSY